MYDLCYLHIGIEKTGTTTLQASLAKNRKFLARRGFAYSKALGTNHLGLAIYAIDEDRYESVADFTALKTRAQQMALRKKLPGTLRWECRANRWLGGRRRLILSNEHCHSRLTSRPEISRLKQLLAETCAAVKVIVYLRPQHEVAISLYSTRLRGGKSGLNPLPDLRFPNPYYDYDALLENWAAVFGRENVVPRIHGRAELANSSVVDDFLEVIGVSKPGFVPVPDKNPNLSREAQAFLDRINPLFTDRKHGIWTKVEGYGGSPGVRPSRGDIEKCIAFFAESNERVRRGWFPQRAALFDVDLESIPKDAINPDLSLREAFEMFAYIWQRR